MLSPVPRVWLERGPGGLRGWTPAPPKKKKTVRDNGQNPTTVKPHTDQTPSWAGWEPAPGQFLGTLGSGVGSHRHLRPDTCDDTCTPKSTEQGMGRRARGHMEAAVCRSPSAGA